MDLIHVWYDDRYLSKLLRALQSKGSILHAISFSDEFRLFYLVVRGKVKLTYPLTKEAVNAIFHCHSSFRDRELECTDKKTSSFRN